MRIRRRVVTPVFGVRVVIVVAVLAPKRGPLGQLLDLFLLYVLRLVHHVERAIVVHTCICVEALYIEFGWFRPLLLGRGCSSSLFLNFFFLIDVVATSRFDLSVLLAKGLHPRSLIFLLSLFLLHVRVDLDVRNIGRSEFRVEVHAHCRILVIARVVGPRNLRTLIV